MSLLNSGVYIPVTIANAPAPDENRGGKKPHSSKMPFLLIHLFGKILAHKMQYEIQRFLVFGFWVFSLQLPEVPASHQNGPHLLKWVNRGPEDYVFQHGKAG